MSVLSGCGGDGGGDGSRSGVAGVVVLLVVIDGGSETRSQELLGSLPRG